MQRGRPGRDGFSGMGDPFGGFGSPFGGFGAFPSPGGLISSFFGGRDPFDDPFFTQPFGGMMSPSFLGRNMFATEGNTFRDHIHGGFLEDQAPQPKKSKGPIIQELTSDDEADELEKGNAEGEGSTKKCLRHGKEPYFQEPDGEMDGVASDEKRKGVQQEMEYITNMRAGSSKPQTQSYNFHSSTVTYGGHGGAYYTSSTTRRTGGDGVTIEESREADTTTGKAKQEVFRGLGTKGHSVTRKLNSDGRVDTVQTLHNLGEDELAGFEEGWRGNARKHLPGYNPEFNMVGGVSSGSGDYQARAPSRGWALPAAEQRRYAGQNQPQARFGRKYSNN